MPLDKALSTNFFPVLTVSPSSLLYLGGWSVSRRSHYMPKLILLVKYYVIPNKVSVGYVIRLLRFLTTAGMFGLELDRQVSGS